MFCHLFYSGHQICGRTSRGQTGGRSQRISPPSFCGACLNFSALIFLARRVQPFLSLVDPEVEFCALTILFEEKSQFVWRHQDSNSRPNVRRFRGYQVNPRDDRPYKGKILLYLHIYQLHITYLQYALRAVHQSLTPYHTVGTHTQQYVWKILQ